MDIKKLREQVELGCAELAKDELLELIDGYEQKKYQAELYDEVWSKAKAMGYMNVTMALCELEPLKSECDELMAQEPVAYGIPNSAITGKSQPMMTLHHERCGQYPELMVPLYVRPIPAQQSPHGLTFEDYEEVLAGHRNLVRELDVLLNGDASSKQASLCDVVAQVSQIVREKGEPLLQQSPAVAVPLGYATNSAMTIFTMGNAEGVVIYKSRTDERCVPVFSKSPRITEQDAREIIESFHRWFARTDINVPGLITDHDVQVTSVYLDNEGRDLINKLNEAHHE